MHSLPDTGKQTGRQAERQMDIEEFNSYCDFNNASTINNALVCHLSEYRQSEAAKSDIQRNIMS